MDKVRDFFMKELDEEDILQKNEIKVNKLAEFTMFISMAVFLIVWGLNRVDIIHLGDMDLFIMKSTVEVMLIIFVNNFFSRRRAWLKYLLILGFTVILAWADAVLSYNSVLVMVVPIILSTQYFDRFFTGIVGAFTAVAFFISAIVNAYYGYGNFDLNFYDPPKGTVLNIDSTLTEAILGSGVDAGERIRDTLVQGYLPKMLIFTIVVSICWKIAESGKEMVLRQKEIVMKSARIESELGLAHRIQTHMLPTIFPPLPNREEIELYATMNPAKAIGGDFYDFFMIDDNKIALVMADVSGKGIPAALVMVITKTLLKNQANMGDSPAETFSKVNHMLCEGNDDGMFVTAWMGVLDTETGILTYSNAGHNPPLLKKGSGEFEFLKTKPGMVLAGIDGIRYQDYELEIAPGDELFLYTDGVTEAINEKDEFYGTDRMQDYLNAHIGEGTRNVLQGLREDIRQFAGNAEQFDDITMMMLKYRDKRKAEKTKKLKVGANSSNLMQVTSFVEEELEKANCSPKLLTQIAICVEEIFVNIAKYAYPKREEDVVVDLKMEGEDMVLRFRDHGVPFDPLMKKDPDVGLALESRTEGGLGIYIVKKTMDDVKYEYQNGSNILTLKKKIKNMDSSDVSRG